MQSSLRLLLHVVADLGGRGSSVSAASRIFVDIHNDHLANFVFNTADHAPTGRICNRTAYAHHPEPVTYLDPGFRTDIKYDGSAARVGDQTVYGDGARRQFFSFALHLRSQARDRLI